MKGNYADLISIKNNIEDWQTNDTVHPFTCGNDSRIHKPLVASLEQQHDEYELTLVCIDCEWKQDVPFVFNQKEMKNIKNDGEQK